MKPDFVYVHLGINDINQNINSSQTLKNIYSFNLLVDELLPGSKLFLSLPLLTGDPFTNIAITRLRDSLHMYVKRFNENNPVPLKDM